MTVFTAMEFCIFTEPQQGYDYDELLASAQVAQVDRMSGGRVELGLGTGWFAEEHAASGIPFPEKRFGLREEQLEIVTGLWATPVGATFDFSGQHHSLTASPAPPKPLQTKIPVIVGGGGPKRTPALAARFADEFNIGFVPDSEVAAASDRVRAACDDIGRDPGSLRLSVAQPAVVGTTEEEFPRRAEQLGADPAELRARNLGGVRSEVEDRLGRLRDLGAGRVYLQQVVLDDEGHLSLLAEITAPFR